MIQDDEPHGEDGDETQLGIEQGVAAAGDSFFQDAADSHPGPQG